MSDASIGDVEDSTTNIKSAMANYGNQIQEYLDKINANVQNYKFTVEKSANGGLSIDLEFKATIEGV